MTWPTSWSTDIRDHLDRYPYLHSRLKRGRGLGWDGKYAPWIKVRNVKDGDGRTTHVRGIRIDRVHHVLSRHERSYLYLAERWPWVTDIREQWPILDPDRTNELHYARGIPIPHRGGFPQPPTIDFMLTETTEKGTLCRAVAIKHAVNRGRKKSQLYLDVQRAWCEENGIVFTVVDNVGDKTLCNTLSFMRNWFVDQYKAPQDKLSDFSDRFNRQHRSNTSLKDLLRPIESALQIDQAEALSLLSLCAWENRIRLDLARPIGMQDIVYLAT